MATEQFWFVLHQNKEQGPFSPKQLKELVAKGVIRPEIEVRLGNQGVWTPAAKVKGLFQFPPPQTNAVNPPKLPETTVIQATPAQQTTPIVATPSLNPIQIQDRIPCAFCGELIVSTAIKCRHCNEFLDGRPRESEPSPQNFMQNLNTPPVTHVNVVVNQQTNVGGKGKYWNPLVAMFLSLIIPGLGQIYKGQLINGLFWFIIVVGGYFFIIPGLILHACCILGAGSGNPYQ